MGLSKGKEVKIEMLDDHSLKITPAFEDNQTKTEPRALTAMTM
ncbi:hypothetical protein [Methanosarcina siciliae]|nr:hypothetical protein [Methanosarcina siciliae]